MATQMIATPSMQAQAEVLMARSTKWAKGTRADGLEFYLFASSRTLADGTPIMNMTRRDGVACSCSGFLYRHLCSHVVAVRILNEQAAFDAESDRLFSGFQKYEIEAAPALAAPAPVARRGYQDLFPDDDSLCDAF